jgi:glucan 1,3-beta-glucosidase
MFIFSQSGHVELTFQQYGANGLEFVAVNTFWRQIRNFIIDLTAIPPTIPPSGSNPTGAIAALHWPTAQATSLQNIIFQLSAVPGNQHQGVFIESGSGGFVTDLVFNNGFNGAVLDNQYVSRSGRLVLD